MYNKIIIAIGFIILIVNGCSKSGLNQDDNLSEKYYLKATIDGRKLNYRMVNFQGDLNKDGFEYIVIGGREGSSINNQSTVDSPGLDFEISRPSGNISVGTYSTISEEDMVARYFIQTPAGTSLYDTNLAKDLFVVKIDAISKQGITGSFYGTLRNQSGKTINVANGDFKLPYEEIINP